MNVMIEKDILGIVYDLIAQNPINGSYGYGGAEHDTITSLVDHVDYERGAIVFINPKNGRQFSLQLIDEYGKNAATASKQKIASDEQIEKVLDSTIHQHGYWLKNHDTLVHGLIGESIQKIGVTDTIKALDDMDGELHTNVYKTIERARDNGFRV